MGLLDNLSQNSFMFDQFSRIPLRFRSFPELGVKRLADVSGKRILACTRIPVVGESEKIEDERETKQGRNNLARSLFVSCH